MGDINTFLIRSGISVQIRRTDGEFTFFIHIQ